MKRLVSTTMLTLLLVALVALVIPAANTSAAEAAAGQEIFLAQKCNMCHSVSSAGIEATAKSEKMKGPDLTNIAAEKGAEWVTSFLKKEVDLDGKKHMKGFSGSDEELKTLVEWLVAQKAD